MLRFTTLVPVLALAISGSLFATPITSTFDVDLDGWTAQHGLLVYNATGNTGGYLEEDDNGQSNMQVIAPAKFLGNLTGFSISVDLNVLGTLPTNVFGGFATLTLSNGGLTMFNRLWGIRQPGGPTTRRLSLWLRLTMTRTLIRSSRMSRKIQLALDPDNKQSEDRTGMDNFTLSNTTADSPIPEPATLGVAGLALIAVALVRRRVQQ